MLSQGQHVHHLKIPRSQRFQNAQGDPLYILFSGSHFGFHDECKEFKKTNKTVISHSFHCLTDTTGQCYRMVIIWIFGVFSWLGNRYAGSFSPGERTLQFQSISSRRKASEHRYLEGF